MELVRSGNTRYEEYEALLTERDALRKEAESVWIRYVQAFGELVNAVYEEKLACVQCKKTIAFYQAALNRGGVVDTVEMRKALEREMAGYYANLKRMREERRSCEGARTSTAYEVRRAKEIYRRLVKLLHPDVNPATDREEALGELWQRTLTAYAHNDLRELSGLEVLARKALKELGMGETRVEIPDIEERIDAVNAEIREIVTTEPYTYAGLLEDEQATAARKAELQAELEDYRRYHRELDCVIRDMQEGGGLMFL